MPLENLQEQVRQAIEAYQALKALPAQVMRLQGSLQRFQHRLEPQTALLQKQVKVLQEHLQKVQEPVGQIQTSLERFAPRAKESKGSDKGESERETWRKTAVAGYEEAQKRTQKIRAIREERPDKPGSYQTDLIREQKSFVQSPNGGYYEVRSGERIAVEDLDRSTQAAYEQLLHAEQVGQLRAEAKRARRLARGW